MGMHAIDIILILIETVVEDCARKVLGKMSS